MDLEKYLDNNLSGLNIPTRLVPSDSISESRSESRSEPRSEPRSDSPSKTSFEIKTRYFFYTTLVSLISYILMIITLLSLDTRAEYLCRILVGSMLPVTAGVWLCGTIISNKFNKVFMEKYKFSERVIKISDIKGHWLPFFTLLTLYILMCIKSRINSPKDIATVTSLGGFLILFILNKVF